MRSWNGVAGRLTAALCTLSILSLVGCSTGVRPSGPVDVKVVPPETVGLSVQKLEAVKKHVESTMPALEAASGAAIVVMRHGSIASEQYMGKQSFAENARPVDARTRFPIISVTKLYLATAVGIAIDKGIFDLDDLVCTYVPEFTGGGKEKVTIRHLVTHTSGLPGDGDWRTDKLAFPPGKQPRYSNVGSDLLCDLFLYKTGFTLGEFLDEHYCKPLGLTETGFICRGDDETYIARIQESDSGPGRLDYDAPECRGATGIHTTARELAILGLLYVRGGTLFGKRILRRRTVRLLLSPQMPKPLREKSRSQGVLWHLNEFSPSNDIGKKLPPGSASHGGWTHCYLLICPKLDFVGVKMLNRGGWPRTFNYCGDFRTFGDLIVDAIVDAQVQPSGSHEKL